MRRSLACLAMLALLVPAAALGVGAQGAPIKIGVPVPLSGGNAKMGDDIAKAATLAAEEWTARGGVLGRKIEIVSFDDACDAQQSVTAAHKLLDAGVVAVAGGYCSSAAIPASAVYHDAGVAFVADASSNPKLTDQGFENVFRVIGRDDQQGPYAAGFMMKTLKAKKIAIIHDNTAYAKGLADATKAAIEGQSGVQVVFFDAVTPGEKDFSAILTKVKSLAPAVTYYTGYYPEGGLIAKQFKELGVPGKFMAGDANNDPTFISEAGNASEGVFVTSTPLPQDQSTAKSFIDRYKKRWNQDPGPYSALEYDAVSVVLDAIKRTGSADRGKIVKAIAATKAYMGATGTINFDMKGDRKSVLYITYIIKGGKFVTYGMS
ncbi:MAG: branched-chain amino acid ABC transporter substrate-binding protein [Bacillati bacterium ANGP1]|uniref:Branched-chain amino acid ABC transporter substrate-binding protein n=1 Tax=Candidatus Segetimicrobium genomatis TaxID=2569760 RepID=A0A537JVX3_9BACT|nr:MAG: branched-chain amino acid ABC transporter substrate-binding protein [Terrabacteria group bacterium ANGP1]